MTIKVRVLHESEVENLQTSSKTLRGSYLLGLNRFAESGDMAWDFSQLFPVKSPEAIRSSLNNNINKHGLALGWPKIKVMIDTINNRCVAINLDLVGELKEQEIELVTA